MNPTNVPILSSTETIALGEGSGGYKVNDDPTRNTLLGLLSRVYEVLLIISPLNFAASTGGRWSSCFEIGLETSCDPKGLWRAALYVSRPHDERGSGWAA